MTDANRSEPGPTPAADWTPGQLENLRALDIALHRLWDVGRNVVLAWCPTPGGLEVLVVPHFLPGQLLLNDAAAARGGLAESIRTLIEGHKQLQPERLALLAGRLGLDCRHVELPQPRAVLQARVIEATVRRYSISYSRDRAVVLFDIVGFSRLAPLVQMIQINSLAFSINAAHDMLRRLAIDIEFARSTTGDGFYIWNRRGSVRANVNLYHLMHLVLADNAIAHTKMPDNLVPVLKTVFHVGGHYEFYQAEALHPSRYNYIVGDVTVDLARIMESARPGQVLVGDFEVPMPAGEDGGRTEPIDSVGFIERLQGSLDRLRDLDLSGERVQSMKCYLTGPRDDQGRYGITRYLIVDKHGMRRAAYNAKINIYREHGPPIYLGLQNRDLAGH